MEPRFYEQTARVEDEHWWYRSRLKLAARYIEAMSLPDKARILDVGCGTGGTTRFLERYGTVTGIDKSAIALEFAKAKTRRAVLKEADANHLDHWFPARSFDLVTFFCVLYHRWIFDEAATLRRVERVLKPGGHVLLMEPAFRILTRRHDAVDLGKTRYRLGNFRRCFAQVGLEYQGGRYFNAAAFPLCLFMAMGHGLFGHGGGTGDLAEIAVPPPLVNRALGFYLDVEHRLTSWIPLPIGVTLVAVGRKPAVSPIRTSPSRGLHPARAFAATNRKTAPSVSSTETPQG